LLFAVRFRQTYGYAISMNSFRAVPAQMAGGATSDVPLAKAALE